MSAAPSHGPYTLQAVQTGILPIPGWEAFFGVNDQAFHELCFYVWLVSDGVRHGLIDVGLPNDPDDLTALSLACQAVDPRCEFRDVRLLPDVLDELGLTPESIDFVLLTQTITYHSGGLESRWFPRAQVYMSRPGIEEMLTDPPGHPPTEFYFTAQSWAFLRELAVEGRLHITDGAVEVVPGVTFETTGGHHPGSAAVRVQTVDGVVGLLETAFFQRNVDDLLPVGIAENAALCRSAIRRYTLDCDRVVAIHDPANATEFSRFESAG